MLVLLAALAVLSPVRARAAVSFDFFYDNLSPYGEWIDVGDYGMCWRPTNVDPDWSPYSDGYWAYTDAGWTWVSYEDFGAIVYHYGRWVRLEDSTWCWVPDSEWAPAWVSWRTSDDYVGWAPLPPEVRCRHGVGIGIWVDSVYDIGPGYYSFCRVRDFGAPVLRPVILNREENVLIVRNTVNVTNITYNTGFEGGSVVFNGGPSFVGINRFSARPIPALKLVTNVNIDPAHWRELRGNRGGNPLAARLVGNQLIVAAPTVAPPADAAAFRAQAKRVISADKISKGWGQVRDQQAHQELRREIQRQAKGFTPETAPARAVAAAELQAVPEKGDPHAVSTVTAVHEHSGKERPAEATVGQSNPGNPNLKPFNETGDAGRKSSSQGSAVFPPKGPAAVSTQENPPNELQRRIDEQRRGEQGAEQARIRAEKEHLGQAQAPGPNVLQQKLAEQEAARAAEARRRESEAQQPQDRQPDLRHAQEAQRQREKGESQPPVLQQLQQQREKVESQRPPVIPQVQQQQPRGNPPPLVPQSNNTRHSKDGKDGKDGKDKEKDKDKNGN